MIQIIVQRSVKFSTFVDKLRSNIQSTDPLIYQWILDEKQRQRHSINLIASENYCSNATFSAAGSLLMNKYAQGYPGARYYGGTQICDKVESQCQKRALEAFSLSPDQWGVNVQVYAGSPANLAVYTALLNPHDRIMSLDLPHGGHLSHGYMSQGKKISSISKFYEILPYFLDQKTEIIDYQELHRMARIYRPKLIVAGTSAYSQLLDYAKFRQICDDVGAYLLADMAHPAGLISAELIPSPFKYADVCTTTTHKTLRGPKGALIYYRVGSKINAKGSEVKYDYKQKIDSTVFPGLQGGPNNSTIAAVAVALGQAIQPQFKIYQKQVLANINEACKTLIQKDYRIVSGGTANHQFLVDLKNKGSNGVRMESLLNQVGIATNKNTVPYDKSAISPSGIRIGSPAMTTRGCLQKDFRQIMQFIDICLQISNRIKVKAKSEKVSDYKAALKQQLEGQQINKLKSELKAFALQFPIPGGLL